MVESISSGGTVHCQRPGTADPATSRSRKTPSQVEGKPSNADEGMGSAANTSTTVATSKQQQSSNLPIRVMTESDLQTTIQWAGQEGWAPGVGDGYAFHGVDHEGFFMAHLPEGRPIAAVSGVRYNEHYGFIGLYICVPEYRGHGHGLAVFNRAMAHLGKERVIGLDAVAAQQANYEKQGFVVAHQIIRFELVVVPPCDGVGGISTEKTQPAVADDGDTDKPPALVVRKLTREDDGMIQKVAEFDLRHIAAPREGFLRNWLIAPGHTARVVVDEDGDSSDAVKVIGFGVLRPCLGGFRIGPIFAESTSVAHMLLREFIAEASSAATVSPHEVKKLFVDVPEPNKAGVEMAEQMGLTRLFALERMYRGPPPRLPLERIFALTTLEVG